MPYAHLNRLKQLLDGVNTELAVTEDRHRACRRTFEAAQLALKAVEQQQSALSKSRDSLKRAIRDARRALQSVSLLPDEILALIFEHAASYTIPGPWSGSYFCTSYIDWDMVWLPKDLRLVCKHWNTVALSTPALWSYIGVPASKEFVDEKSYPEYLRLHLERSRQSLLSVVIDANIGFHFEESWSDPASPELKFIKRALDILGTEVHRIRTLEVFGGSPSYRATPSPFRPWDRRGGFCNMIMGLLRLPTPNLEDLYIVIRQEREEEREPWFIFPDEPGPLPLYLPEAPKLRRLRLDHLPVLCRLPHPGLPSLTVLSLEFYLMHEAHFLDTLTLCPALEELSLHVEILTKESRPTPRTITIPIQRLEIGFRQSSHRCVERLVLPNVVTVEAPAWYIPDVAPKVAATVTRLTIGNGDVEDDLMPVLATMKRVEEVSFTCDAIDDGMLADVLCADDPLWPQLRNLEVHAAVNIESGAHLLRAVEHRAGGSEGRGRALEKITFLEDEVASWVGTRLKALLGPENVTVV